MARAGHRAMLEHNDLARAALATIPTGPNAMRVSDAMLGMMLAGGVPPQVAAWATRPDLPLHHRRRLRDVDLAGAGDRRRHGRRRRSLAQLSTDLVAYFAELPDETYPHLRKHARELAPAAPTPGSNSASTCWSTVWTNMSRQ